MYTTPRISKFKLYAEKIGKIHRQRCSHSLHVTVSALQVSSAQDAADGMGLHTALGKIARGKVQLIVKEFK